MNNTSAKGYRNGTHRLTAPEQTLARIRPLMPAMGITRIANVTGLDRIGIPVVMVCRPNSRSLAVYQGKGLDLTSAKASGLMEAAESYHAETISLPLKLASYAELKREHDLIAIARMARSAENRFHEHLQLLWIEGRELNNNIPVWLPYESVYTNYTLPFPPGSGCFVATSNGLASGNHYLEAASHAICELIERDAITLWYCRSEEQNRQCVLDLDSVDDPACRQVLALYEQAAIDVRVWDTTSDIGVACFYCLIASRHDDGSHPEFGAGCHPAREIALLRALTEAAQVRTTYIAGSRDDLLPEQYENEALKLSLSQGRNLLRRQTARRIFQSIPTLQTDTFEADVRYLLERLHAIGCAQAVAVDLSKEALEIPVVRMVIPGLEALYDGEGGAYVPGERALRILKQ